MIHLYRYPERYAIVSLAADEAIPTAPRAGYYTCIRDKNEVTVVLRDDHLPANPCKVVGGYRIVMLDTEFPFDVIGVLAKCSAALAQAGIPIMAYSSYKTDVFMFQETHFDRACAILEGLEF